MTTMAGASPSQISAKRSVCRASRVSSVRRSGVVDGEEEVEVEGAADADVVGGTSSACNAAVAMPSAGSAARTTDTFVLCCIVIGAERARREPPLAELGGSHARGARPTIVAGDDRNMFLYLLATRRPSSVTIVGL